ncbi:MAG: OmpH family outer membrane protein [Bacteroidetes bacterium]|nr:OmpH family outer membrane protein [Bacteroidota bacterium]
MTSRILKNAVLSLLMLTSSYCVKSQGVKIGYLNYGNVVLDLPEYKVMNDSLMSYYLTLQEDLKKIEDDYIAKQTELNKKIESGNQNKRLIELEQYALEQLQQIYQFQQRENEEKIAQKQEELLAPLRKKVDDAIEAIAKEKGFTLVLDASVIHYKREADDVENLVRAKLKVITKEESEKKRKEGGDNNVETPPIPKNTIGN